MRDAPGVVFVVGRASTTWTVAELDIVVVGEREGKERGSGVLAMDPLGFCLSCNCLSMRYCVLIRLCNHKKQRESIFLYLSHL